jgi:hypothetical protein
MRSVVNVATGRYVRGQERLTEWLSSHNENDYFVWRDMLPAGSPAHVEIPYAFKAYALREAIAAGAKTLLWADASVVPVQDLTPLWERIERDGYWISDQAGPEHDKGWSNYEWTADEAYADLFSDGCYEHFQWDSLRVSGTNPITGQPASKGSYLDWCRGHNRNVPHVVATTFGFSMDHEIGRALFAEYFRLASETKAFCGPWVNANYKGEREDLPRVGCCGPPDVRGHRHDQTALSVIAWRLGCKLTRWPDPFAYRGHEDERTILVAEAIS